MKKERKTKIAGLIILIGVIISLTVLLTIAHITENYLFAETDSNCTLVNPDNSIGMSTEQNLPESVYRGEVYEWIINLTKVDDHARFIFDFTVQINHSTEALKKTDLTMILRCQTLEHYLFEDYLIYYREEELDPKEISGNLVIENQGIFDGNSTLFYRLGFMFMPESPAGQYSFIFKTISTQTEL